MSALLDRLRNNGAIPVTSTERAKEVSRRDKSLLVPIFDGADPNKMSAKNREFARSLAPTTPKQIQDRAWVATKEVLSATDTFMVTRDMTARSVRGAHKVSKRYMARPAGHNFQVRSRYENKILHKQESK